MIRKMCRSKIKGLKITGLNLDDIGSIGIDGKILKEADIVEGEEIYVLNKANGIRFETYVIPEEEGSKKVVLYGPSARLAEVGDEITILSWAFVSDGDVKEFKIKTVYV
ncbi:TPA: aspartate 1-decarboxylase [bacterium]|nr:aspartate 1-decarboxylase [bacterium]